MGSSGGPLTPSADQLNHDVIHIQGQELSGLGEDLLSELSTKIEFLSDRGIDLAHQGRLQEALNTFQSGLAIARQNGDYQKEAEFLNNVGDVLLQQRYWLACINSYQASAEVLCRLGNRRGEADSVIRIGIVLAVLGISKSARQSLEWGLGVAREFGDRQAEGKALVGLGLVDAEDDWGKASDNWREAIELLEE